MSITPISHLRKPAFGEVRKHTPRTLHENSVDDETLARAISRDSTAALEELIGRYWEALTSYASRILDDMGLAEDTVLKVFTTVWIDRSRWAPRSVRAYLFRCTRNYALDELRSRTARQRRERLLFGADITPPPEPDRLLEEATLAEMVDAAIQSLPQRRREAFVLTHLKQLSYTEVAEIMDVSTKTVGHHVSAALADLRQALAALVAHDEDPGPVQSIRRFHRNGNQPPDVP